MPISSSLTERDVHLPFLWVGLHDLLRCQWDDLLEAQDKYIWAVKRKVLVR